MTPTMLIDVTGAVAKTFGGRRGLVALVRPDGYLGYRGLPNQPGELASYLARVFAMRRPDAEMGSAALAEPIGQLSRV
jgi:hypothetical protein